MTAHALRHSFAKNLVDAGVGSEQVATLLGRENLESTRLYDTLGGGFAGGDGEGELGK